MGKENYDNKCSVIYPDYADIMNEFRRDYEAIISLIDSRLKDVILNIIESSHPFTTPQVIENFLEKRNKNTNIKKP